MPKQLRTRDRKRTKQLRSISRLSSSESSLSLGLQQIHEVYDVSLSSTGAGVIASTTAITPAALLLAARLTGYRAIADEVRFDLVNVRLVPSLGKSSTGRVTMYIERDPTAAIVASVNLASDQREKVIGTIRDPLSLTWRPQEPADREFNLLNPGTVSLGSFMVVGDEIRDAAASPFSGLSYTMTISVAMTIRGRP